MSSACSRRINVFTRRSHGGDHVPALRVKDEAHRNNAAETVFHGFLCGAPCTGTFGALGGNSKFLTVPPRQTIKLLALSLPSVAPVIAPSSTVQYAGSPSQHVRWSFTSRHYT